MGDTELSAKEIVRRFQRLPDLPDDFPSTWRVVVDGELVRVERHLIAVLQKPGRPEVGVNYGLVDDRKFSFDGFCHTSFGGGGVLTVPFVILNSELWVVTVAQYRFLTDQRLLSFPHGYKPSGISFAEHAATELTEELGTFRTDQIKGASFSLSPAPTYSSTHILDWRPLPNETNPGEYQFGLELNPSCFVTDTADGRPQLKPGIFAPGDPLEALTEGRVLQRWEVATEREGSLGGATLRLMAWLRKHNVITSF